MSEETTKRELVREERRRQILEAAVAVFSRKGYNTANVSDVAAEAGVSQGTIYWYFESKEELMTAAMLTALEDFGRQMYTDLEGYARATEKLRAVGESMVAFVDVAQGYFMMFVEFWSSSSRRWDTSQLWTGLLVEYKDLIAGIIKEGIASGEFRPVDADSLVWALMAAYDGLAVYGMLVSGLDLAVVSRVFVETLLRGIRAQPAAEEGSRAVPEA
jgi:AcrR family transcriptional regulator